MILRAEKEGTKMKILFRGAELIDKGVSDIVTDGKFISYIGEKAPEDSYDRVIDCKNKMMLPGLYNCHTHAAMTLFRGYGEDMPLQQWLTERIFPAEDLLTGHAVHTASLFAIAEMIRGGIVSFSDMYFFCEDTAAAVEKTGIKANLSRAVTSFDKDIDMNSDPRFAEAKVLFAGWNNACDGRIKIDMAIHAEYTNVEKACRAVAEYASENSAGLHIHLSETESEHKECIERHGKTPAEFFADCGCFDVPVTAAHCVWVEDGDIELMAKHSVTAVYNPVSNLKLGSGVMPMKKLLDGGVNVALGTDGAASNNTLDIFKEMHVGAIAQKGFMRDPSKIGAAELIAAATVNGAAAQGRSDSGCLEAGKCADLILVDLDAINNIPYYDLRYTAVYSACSSNVKLTMVDGNILYENGEYTTIDEEKLKFDMRNECGGYFKNKKQ